MHEYIVVARGKDDRASVIDDTVVSGREAVDQTIKTFRAKHGDKLQYITVWNETAQRPAKGWNDEYR